MATQYAIFMETIKRDDTEGIFIPFEEVPDIQEFEDVDSETSKVGEKLGLNGIIENDFDIEVKARIIDKFLKENIKSESMKDSEKYFENNLNKLSERLGISIINELQKGNALALLDKLFREIAIKNNLSAETFLKKSREEYRQSKVKSLLNKLKQLTK